MHKLFEWLRQNTDGVQHDLRKSVKDMSRPGIVPVIERMIENGYDTDLIARLTGVDHVDIAMMRGEVEEVPV